ncbi:UNVERIFIED_CONTAM: hypothetical protein Scaly_2958200 [Sesamum calycinum]|uniref:Gag-pol polyprotein n=1 Tax=Sesamum calycinum TaxID=2727403 RepID=A0AAW2KQW9_9LAMI
MEEVMGLTHRDPWRRGPKDEAHDGDGGNKEIMSKNPLTVILDSNKFNGTNYTDWLRNLSIVLDYENQGYIMDKPLPQTLPDGSSSEEHRHTRYVATKEFFSAKMIEGSSVQEHGVKMLSLVEKLEDLKAGLENDTYIDVILQSLPPSYDPFIVNFNMDGLEKSINELINMLVQYKAMIKKSAPSVLIGNASISKAKGKRAGR